MTLAGLRKIKALIQAECQAGRFKDDKSFPDGTRCKGTTSYETLTTTDVVYRYVKDEGVTGHRRLADAGLLGDETHFATPSLFISHAWKGGFSKLLEEVFAYADKQGLLDDYAVWLDVIGVNQVRERSLLHYHPSTRSRSINLCNSLCPTARFKGMQRIRPEAESGGCWCISGIWTYSHTLVYAHAPSAPSLQLSFPLSLSVQDVLQTCLDGTLVVCDFGICETYSRAW